MYKGHPDQYFGHITYSQHGEDLMIANLFRLMKIEKPSYLDVGAHHPLDISNTALLYSRGSRGVNVEANPNLIEEFLKLRPEDKTIQVGVGPYRTRKPFWMFDDRSGLNTFRAETAERAGRYLDRKAEKRMEIDIVTLDDIVSEHFGGKYPDFLSLDIEGLDYAVLENANLHVAGPKVICVEVKLPETGDFQWLLDQKGYVKYCRMGENLIFVSEAYIPIFA